MKQGGVVLKDRGNMYITCIYLCTKKGKGLRPLMGCLTPDLIQLSIEKRKKIQPV